MNYGGFKDLPRRTASDNLLHEKAFDIAKDPKYDGCQQGFASMVFNFLDKMSVSTSGGAIKNKTTQYQQLAAPLEEELHKQIIKKFEKRKV